MPIGGYLTSCFTTKSARPGMYSLFGVHYYLGGTLPVVGRVSSFTVLGVSSLDLLGKGGGVV